MELKASRFTVSITSSAAMRLARAAINSPPIGRGESGQAVTAVQQALIDLGNPDFYLAQGANGSFGEDMVRAVRAFQAANGLIQDGIVGQQVLEYLDRLYRPEVVGKAKGISLHFGLNSVNPDVYGGWPGELVSCENDAQDMAAIAQSLGFETRVHLTKNATSVNFFAEIDLAARSLAAGDIMLVTFAGHGDQIDNSNTDEEGDWKDETLCFFDRMVIDDELYARFTTFRHGVRIVVVADSCHSGSVIRVKPREQREDPRLTAEENATLTNLRYVIYPETENAVRRADQRAIEANLSSNKDLYTAIQTSLGAFDRIPVEASVLLLSACQDNQFAASGYFNGKFTEKLLKVWNKGAFDGDYRQFHREISRLLPAEQQPNYFFYGATNYGFEAQRPFHI